MLGIIVGALEESKYGLTIVQQFQTRAPGIFIISAVIIYASLVPIQHGALREPFGIFTPHAELVNARLAMIGFVAILLLESKAQLPFF